MTVTTQAVEELLPVKRRTPLADTWDNLRRSWGGVIGLSLIVLHLLLALISPYIVPHDPLLMDAQIRNEAPSAEHLFGTDKLGRDLFSRSMVGGRVALLVTMLGTALAMTWGGLTGILLGFLGGEDR